ncbi:MAG: glycine cleavage system aminomethyltransferase GcvT [Candidatus Omnitrophica bacterium]|nr:glycine cleavage system aminomethyltransferase GcvT [Candidatus Omnitrophota bacterium]
MLNKEQLQRTPLYDEHVALGAKMVPFGGWAMPVQYDSIIKEHGYTRKAAAIFDISHMGEFIIEGNCVENGLDAIVTMPLRDLPIKSCRYGCALNEQGGVMDDLIIFRLEEEKWFIVVNGATTQKDKAHFQKHLKNKTVFTDVSMKTGKIDLQGPLSLNVLSSFVADAGKLDYYTCDYFDLMGERVLISRTGYTGELGYEIYFPWDKTKDLWQALISRDDVKPAGLGARDILRIEMGYSLYGHELGEDISPLESGLDRFVSFEKDFLGKLALLKQKGQGLKRKIVGIQSETRRAPRQGQKICLESGEEVGVVTSGTFSPSLGLGIGLGFVAAQSAALGAKVFFGDQKSKNVASVVSRTFYKDGSLRHKTI